MAHNRNYKSDQDREQSFLPPRIEDYVGRDNPVRAIDAYVDSLDLAALRFREVGSDGGAGQPPYAPGDLLKPDLHGYLNQVRSSRRLEREARRNTELMWLLRGLAPGYRTIANFRKDNHAALFAAHRDFVLLIRRHRSIAPGLLGGELVAIDGAFFHGDASKASIVTEKRLQEQIAAVERSIAEYTAALDAAGPQRRRRDRRDAAFGGGAGGHPGGAARTAQWLGGGCGAAGGKREGPLSRTDLRHLTLAAKRSIRAPVKFWRPPGTGPSLDEL